MADAAGEAEAELAAFRQRWRDEVSARNKKATETALDSRNKLHSQRTRETVRTRAPVAGPSNARRKDDYSEELEPKAYHDLPDKEEYLRLGAEGQNHDRHNMFREPSSALEHYERAVEKETVGQLGDSLKHYRKAFKLDDGVHEAYKQKHFPPSAFKSKATQLNPSNPPVTVPETGHHSLHGSGAGALPPSLKELVEQFASFGIEPPPPETDLSPPKRSRFGELPEEILSQILLDLAVKDVASFARLAQVCKRLAYLIMTEDAIWKRVATGPEHGFAAMHYDYACDIDGDPLSASDEIARFLASHDQESDLPEDLSEALPTPEERQLASSAHTEQLLQSRYAGSWRQMFRQRPRIRFNGCYISTVNYNRPGATNTNSTTWGTPILIVTYFRYLRFFRDGTVISLLTTSEPADVVHHLTKENLHSHHRSDSMLPSAVMKDALRGRWRLSSPLSSVKDSITGEPEVEGDVQIETEGVVPKYNYRLLLAMSHAGKGARNNKLAWKGFWSHNKLTDDWGEFGLRNDKAFYWSRVRSYGS